MPLDWFWPILNLLYRPDQPGCSKRTFSMFWIKICLPSRRKSSLISDTWVLLFIMFSGPCKTTIRGSCDGLRSVHGPKQSVTMWRIHHWTACSPRNFKRQILVFGSDPRSDGSENLIFQLSTHAWPQISRDLSTFHSSSWKTEHKSLQNGRRNWRSDFGTQGKSTPPTCPNDLKSLFCSFHDGYNTRF